ncbi:hypothetical protein KSS87_004722 [Heliosperma pusillum]|nr:hypothetical protein KSS87_004722 [Heliosperma pusillum]
MEKITNSSMLISLGFVVVVTLLVKAVNWVWFRPKKLEKWLRQQGLAGTSYKFLFGDLKDYASMRSRAMERPMTAFSNDYSQRVDALRHHLTSKLGRDYFVWAGPTPMVNISKPELVKEGLTKMHDFQKPKVNPIADKLFPGFVNYEGDKWAKHRKMITPAFHLEKLKLMLPAFHESCAEMMDKWEKVVAETGSGEVDAWAYFTKLSADVISRAAFGSSYKQGQRIFELLKEQTDIAVHMLGSVYFPGLKYIPTAGNRRFKQIEDELQNLLKGIVNKRKQETEAGEETKNDLLGLLLDSNSKAIQQAANSNSQQLGMNLQEVIDECKLFYFAGQETTSVLIVWTMILLSKYQDWQARAREEVLKTFGNDLPDFEGLSHLKTVTMILYEVLRLYPPATHLTRRVYKDAKLGDISLPAGTLMTFPILFIHRDTEYWGDDAEEFKPERFAEGVSKATSGKNTFFPFGWGPRICIGEKFSMIEAKMVLSMILQRFSFELSPTYAHAPMTVIFLQPQHGAQIILHSRK